MNFLQDAKIEGDYLEFGVWMGNSFVPAYHYAQFYGHKRMRFYAFDSFEGLPETKGIDASYVYGKGAFSCDQQEFKSILKGKRVDMSKVTLVPGWFNKTLNSALKKRLKIKKAAVIWIDCDLYSSTVPVLDFVTDYVQDGTVMVFDDWLCFKGDPSKGEQKAFKEWLKKNPSIKATEFQRYGWGGMSFILHKTQRRTETGAHVLNG